MQRPDGPEPQQGHAEALLVHYWYVLKKRKLVVFSFMGFLALTVTIATLLATPYYSATALVEISPKAPTVLEVDAVTDFVTASTGQELRNYYATQYKIIQSRSVMERAVKILQEEEGITDFDHVDDPPEFLHKHLIIEPVVETHLVKVTVEYPDPEKAALFANTIARAYREFNLERALESGRQALEWLQEEQKAYRDRKLKSDEQVHDFRAKLGLLGIDERYNSTVERYDTVQKAWTEAATERIQAQAVYDKLMELSRQEDWTPLANHLAGENPALEALLHDYQALEQERARLASRYKERHPEMVRVTNQMAGIEAQIKAEVDRTIAGKRAELQVLTNRERALKKELDKVEEQVKDLDKQLIQLRLLESDAKQTEELYKSLDERRAEVDLSQVLKANNIRTVDEALPDPVPVRPKLAVNLAMSLVLGLFGGVVLAFLLEYLDVTVKTREDIEQVIGVPLLGVVPIIPPDDLHSLPNELDRNLYVHARPRSTAAECMRSIRTNVLFRTPQSAVRTLLITSAAPREGKSFTSSNLAAIIAMTGSRVLLIDADLRRPALHKRFGLPNDVGLCSLFTGDATLDQVVQPTHIDGLSVMVAGPPPSNPGEMLGSDRMVRLLKSFRNYDFVIVDSPPVNVVADPLVLSSMVDGVLLVVEANRTGRNVVKQAVARLREMKANVLGAMVNKLNIRTAGYGYYYYDNYGYYYTEAEQERGAG